MAPNPLIIQIFKYSHLFIRTNNIHYLMVKYDIYPLITFKETLSFPNLYYIQEIF